MKDLTWMFRSMVVPALALAVLVPLTHGGPTPKKPKQPATVEISVSPGEVAPGAEARVTVRIQPSEGVKINRYPQIKLTVPESPVVSSEAEIAVGNTSPPPPDKMNDNYFDEVDPIALTLQLNDSTPSGKHQVEGKLVYYYCVIASGYCAPSREAVSIPIQVP